jgi:cell division protein ZapA
MSTVTLTIGPKSYSVACADGQEAHITQLGAMIAEKYAQLGTSRAPLEAQNLLFAALFLADELAEARKGGGEAPAAPGVADPEVVNALQAAISELERDLEEARAATAAPISADPEAGQAQTDLLTDNLASQLEALADRAEANAAALEAAVTNA